MKRSCCNGRGLVLVLVDLFWLDFVVVVLVLFCFCFRGLSFNLNFTDGNL